MPLPKLGLASHAAEARARAAFQHHDSLCEGCLGPAALTACLAELGTPPATAAELGPRLARELGGEEQLVTFDDFHTWWENVGKGCAEVPWSKRARSHLNKGWRAGHTFSQYGDDFVDEYDGLKVIARNKAFSRYTILVSVVAIGATVVEEYGDLFDEEMIEGCTDINGTGPFSLDNCELAGFGQPGCYQTWRLRKAGGLAGTTLIFTFFFCIMLTLVWIRYRIWLDQATVFELLQFRIAVATKRRRYVCMLAVLLLQVTCYGMLKVWLTSEHEKGNFLEGGVNSKCNFKPQVRVHSHAAQWYTIIYRGIMFMLVLQAPLRDIVHASADLYYLLTISDILRSGHPRPHRLVEAFRLVQFEALRKHLDDYAEKEGVRRQTVCHKWPPGFISRAVADFVDTHEHACCGESGVVLPVNARRRQRWQEIMAQAYALAGIPPARPGAECLHEDNCFRREDAAERSAVMCRLELKESAWAQDQQGEGAGGERAERRRSRAFHRALDRRRRASVDAAGRGPLSAPLLEPPGPAAPGDAGCCAPPEASPATADTVHLEIRRAVGVPLGLSLGDGLQLRSVVSGSAADRAGASKHIGRRLLRVGRRTVSSAADAVLAITALPPSSPVQLTLSGSPPRTGTQREWLFVTADPVPPQRMSPPRRRGSGPPVPVPVPAPAPEPPPGSAERHLSPARGCRGAQGGEGTPSPPAAESRWRRSLLQQQPAAAARCRAGSWPRPARGSGAEPL